MPSWSPDARTIVFQRTQGTINADLWLVDAAGGNERPVMGSQASPMFSPDGRMIAFASPFPTPPAP